MSTRHVTIWKCLRRHRPPTFVADAKSLDGVPGFSRRFFHGEHQDHVGGDSAADGVERGAIVVVVVVALLDHVP